MPGNQFNFTQSQQPLPIIQPSLSYQQYEQNYLNQKYITTFNASRLYSNITTIGHILGTASDFSEVDEVRRMSQEFLKSQQNKFSNPFEKYPRPNYWKWRQSHNNYDYQQSKHYQKRNQKEYEQYKKNQYSKSQNE